LTGMGNNIDHSAKQYIRMFDCSQLVRNMFMDLLECLVKLHGSSVVIITWFSVCLCYFKIIILDTQKLKVIVEKYDS